MTSFYSELRSAARLTALPTSRWVNWVFPFTLTGGGHRHCCCCCCYSPEVINKTGFRPFTFSEKKETAGVKLSEQSEAADWRNNVYRFRADHYLVYGSCQGLWPTIFFYLFCPTNDFLKPLNFWKYKLNYRIDLLNDLNWNDQVQRWALMIVKLSYLCTVAWKCVCLAVRWDRSWVLVELKAYKLSTDPIAGIECGHRPFHSN